MSAGIRDRKGMKYISHPRWFYVEYVDFVSSSGFRSHITTCMRRRRIDFELFEHFMYANVVNAVVSNITVRAFSHILLHMYVNTHTYVDFQSNILRLMVRVFLLSSICFRLLRCMRADSTVHTTIRRKDTKKNQIEWKWHLEWSSV